MSEFDPEGYLLDINDWSETLAQTLAVSENIKLTAVHWAIIHFVRRFYLQHQTMPKMRELITFLRQQPESQDVNSLQIQRLFPLGPALQIAKIAGLPKPVRCL